MMMSRTNTAPAPDEPTSHTFSTVHAKASLAASAGERVHDLERRLDLLDSAPSAEAIPPAVATAAAPSAPGTGTPLLKRIQAAQERARCAEQQEKDAAAAQLAAAEAERFRAAQAQAQAQEEEARIAGDRSALRHAANRALEDKQNKILRQLEGKQESATLVALPPSAAAATFEAAAAPGVPIMTSLDTPPPSFDSMKFPPPRTQQPPTPEMVGHGMNSRALTREQPPATAPPAPTAPQYTDHLHDIRPVAPPPAVPPPPSFAEFEHAAQTAAAEDDDGIFATDEHGNPLTLQQRRAMVAEQRRLYERIAEDNAARSKDAAADKADAFDSRSANAAARALPGADARAARDEADGARGRNVRDDDDPARRTVRIGPNQTAAIHGQDRTKQAITDGTAILVQCLSCQNWMQVTDTATLMMCPVCQVVSPVVPQDQVHTKEEAIQLTMDRKMAEKLQAEEDAGADEEEGSEGGGGIFGSLFGSGGEAAPAEEGAATSETAPAAASAAAASDSWWDRMASMVSYGVAVPPADRGDLGVTRPPGNPGYPGAQRRARSPVEETRGLLAAATFDGDAARLPAGRVAEQRPLFSCMVEGVSNAASAVFSTDAAGDTEDSDALVVTRAERGMGNGMGEYARVPDNQL